MSPTDQMRIAQVLVKLGHLMNLKGAILITFDHGERMTFPWAPSDTLLNEITKVGIELHHLMKDGKVTIPTLLD